LGEDEGGAGNNDQSDEQQRDEMFTESHVFSF
jgi:hypothetical protein